MLPFQSSPIVLGGRPLPLGLTAEVMVVASTKSPKGSVWEVGQLGPTSVAIDYVAVNGPQNRNSFANAHASSMCGGVRARVAQRLSLRCPVRSVRSVVGARPPRGARGRRARREPCEAHGFQRLGADP